jgi:hypothetical protein
LLPDDRRSVPDRNAHSKARLISFSGLYIYIYTYMICPNDPL